MFLKKLLNSLRNLPDNQKKVVFLVIMAIILLIAGYFELIITKNNIVRIKESLASEDFSSTSQIFSNSKSENGDNFNTNEDQTAALLKSLSDLNSLTTSQADLSAIQNMIKPQNNTINTSWQPYINQQYRLEASYPFNFFAKEMPTQRKDFLFWIIFADSKFASSNELYPKLSIKVFNAAGTPQQWIKNNFKSGVFHIAPENIKEVTINGKKSFQFFVKGEKTTNYYTVWQDQSGKILLLEYDKTPDSTYPTDIYQKFISKFTWQK